jgi:hypothetical protein
VTGIASFDSVDAVDDFAERSARAGVIDPAVATRLAMPSRERKVRRVDRPNSNRGSIFSGVSSGSDMQSSSRAVYFIPSLQAKPFLFFATLVGDGSSGSVREKPQIIPPWREYLSHLRTREAFPGREHRAGILIRRAHLGGYTT